MFVAQEVREARLWMGLQLLTISKLKRWSINYYIDTAQTAERASSDLQIANGGLGEYYSERETRTPGWLCAGNATPARCRRSRPSRSRDRPVPIPVRNGDRWRVAAIDPTTHRVAGQRLTDHARAVLDADYVREHLTHGYATTVHSAPGVTAAGPGRTRPAPCSTSQ